MALTPFVTKEDLAIGFVNNQVLVFVVVKTLSNTIKSIHMMADLNSTLTPKLVVCVQKSIDVYQLFLLPITIGIQVQYLVHYYLSFI